MHIIKREEKLKYARFAIELNRAIQRKSVYSTVKSFKGIQSILQIFIHKGLIKGFEIVDPSYITIFFRFNVKKGSPVLKRIKLLTKTSLKAFTGLDNLKYLQFTTKSFFPSFFILATREGLTPIDTRILPKTGGELIYKIN
jgi:ribosomal protein S8